MNVYLSIKIKNEPLISYLQGKIKKIIRNSPPLDYKHHLQLKKIVKLV